MLVIAVSLLVGLLGVVATRAAVGRLAAEATERDPHVYWALGRGAAPPAWLIVFLLLPLLGTRSRPRSVDWNRRGSCGHDRPFELLVAVIATA